jgi:hypothetical protein
MQLVSHQGIVGIKNKNNLRREQELFPLLFFQGYLLLLVCRWSFFWLHFYGEKVKMGMVSVEFRTILIGLSPSPPLRVRSFGRSFICFVQSPSLSPSFSVYFLVCSLQLHITMVVVVENIRICWLASPSLQVSPHSLSFSLFYFSFSVYRFDGRLSGFLFLLLRWVNASRQRCGKY